MIPDHPPVNTFPYPQHSAHGFQIPGNDPGWRSYTCNANSLNKLISTYPVEMANPFLVYSTAGKAPVNLLAVPVQTHRFCELLITSPG